MARHPRTRSIGVGMLLGLATLLPALVGQGCPGSAITPITSGQGASRTDSTPDSSQDTIGTDGTTGNPSLIFTYPLVDVAAAVGQVIKIEWSVTGSTNAAITLLLDPDRTYGNGNEIVVLPLVLVNDPVNGHSFDMDTSSLRPSTYRIMARITDGINPEQIVVAAGRLLLYGAGLLPGNVSPTIVVTQPMNNLGVSQADLVDIRFCGRDIDDDGKTPPTPPDILLMLDLDNDPTNDINLSGPDAAQFVKTLCQTGSFPVAIKATPTSPPSAYVLACRADSDCGKPSQVQGTNADGTPMVDAKGNPVLVTVLAPDQAYQLTIDVGSIPPREDGSPYYVRALMWDHVNRPVNGYAPGTISITATGSGVIDLASVGRTISGSKFKGFNAGDLAGSTGCDLGDIDGDGANDFAIVSRFGSGSGLQNTGTVHVVMGLPNKGKFASEIPLNSVGTTYRGSLLTMPGTTGTQGITSISRTEDVTGDSLPDFIVGAPYVEVLSDCIDDDPLDKNDLPCYGDLLPNPRSDSPPGYDPMTAYDYHEMSVLKDDVFHLCSNDEDLTRATPINGGYVFLVSSEDPNRPKRLTSGVFGLNSLGQSSCYKPVLTGARFRGPWYPWPGTTSAGFISGGLAATNSVASGLLSPFADTSQTVNVSAIDPTNWFGHRVASMPDMTNTSLTIPARYGSTMLISAPHGDGDRGMVIVQDRTHFFLHAEDANAFGQIASADTSFPVYWKDGDTARGLAYPSHLIISGQQIGDHLGYAASAGDYNLDGSRDIAMGAPDASRDGLRQNGIVYIMFGRPSFPSYDLRTDNIPRMEIHGTANDDQYGTMQAIIGDINQDGLPDIGFSSQYADGPGGVDSGFIGIIFGGRLLTGENIFTVNQVATAQLPGVKIYGTQQGGHAGAVISNAGDFNGDSIDDLLIVAPDEVRPLNGTQRRGVAYLIFGGPHMSGNKSFNLSQVGTPDLPGIVFVSPYAKGSAEEAPIDWASAAGDINNDGFGDILIGISEADDVNPLEPSQRRNKSGEMYLIYGSNAGSNTITVP